MIETNTQQLQQLCSYAEKTYPEECCGLLLGTNSQITKKIVKIWQTENSWQAEDWQEWDRLGSETNKQNRFSIAPQDILAARKWARQSQLDIIGVYHSHCDGEAIPSEFDRAIAWPFYSYIIIGVQAGVATDVRCWTLDQQHQFVSETIIKEPDNN